MKTIFFIAVLFAAGYLLVGQSDTAQNWIDENIYSHFDGTATDPIGQVAEASSGLEEKLKAVMQGLTEQQLQKIADLEKQVIELEGRQAELEKSLLSTQSSQQPDGEPHTASQEAVYSHDASQAKPEVDQLAQAESENPAPEFMSDQIRHRELSLLIEEMQLRSAGL